MLTEYFNTRYYCINIYLLYRTRKNTEKHYYKQLRNICHTSSWLKENGISVEPFNFTKEDYEEYL